MGKWDGSYSITFKFHDESPKSNLARHKTERMTNIMLLQNKMEEVSLSNTQLDSITITWVMEGAIQLKIKSVLKEMESPSAVVWDM